MFQTVQAEPVTECSNEKERQKKRREKQKLLLNTPTALAIWTRPKCVVSTGPGRLLENDAE